MALIINRKQKTEAFPFHMCKEFKRKTFQKQMEACVKITVRKLAETAGVSPATVSRYLNGSENVSPTLAGRVEEALLSMGGSPVLRQERKQTVLILLTHLRFDFYSRTLAELLEQEATGDYTFALLRYDPRCPEIVRSYVTRNHPVGVLYFEEEMDRQILAYLQKCGLRTVMCGGTAVDRQSDRVHVNDIAAAYEGTRYLLKLGHRDILFLSDDEQKIGAGFQRITGSRRAMEEQGLNLPDEQVLRCGVTFTDGYDAMRHTLSDGRQFTAVFAFSDELALGAMAALYDAGVRVPEDVSVLGYDDLPCAMRVRPALTTVHQPIDAIVRKSLELFAQPPQAIHTEILLSHSIAERQSCRRFCEKTRN